MDISEITNKLSSGGKEDIRIAITQIEKIRISKGKRYPQEYIELLAWAKSNLNEIENPVNQVAILKALKLPLMYLGSHNYEDCVALLFNSLQHPDGRVREQAYNSANWFLTDITPDNRWRTNSEIKREKKATQLIDFVVKLDETAEEHKHEAKGRVYLNDMKPCVYKSLQRLLCRILRNEWLLETVHHAGYVESPSFEEIFSDDSTFWDLTPLDLELHEMEFVMRIKKGKKLTQKAETRYQMRVSLFRNKKIYRIIQINRNTSLYGFGEAITDSFDFDFDHCFGFYSDWNNGFLHDSLEQYDLFTDIPEVEPTGAGSVKHTKIKDVWTQVGKKMLFVFDYGVSWIFEVELIGSAVIHKQSTKHFYEIIKSIGKSPIQYS